MELVLIFHGLLTFSIQLKLISQLLLCLRVVVKIKKALGVILFPPSLHSPELSMFLIILFSLVKKYFAGHGKLPWVDTEIVY